MSNRDQDELDSSCEDDNNEVDHELMEASSSNESTRLTMMEIDKGRGDVKMVHGTVVGMTLISS